MSPQQPSVQPAKPVEPPDPCALCLAHRIWVCDPEGGYSPVCVWCDDAFDYDGATIDANAPKI